ncbi:MAG: arginine N-succinyltransferase, partial [Bacteroidota bacterium]
MKQTTSTLLMIQPAAFFFNEETAENNYYQDASKAVAKTSSQDLALIEFNEFVDLLRANHIEVIVVPDLVENQTPDSIFPNNWVSFHENGHVFLYPMYAKSRRKERRPEILDQVQNSGFSISTITDLSFTENDGLYLEGTGSMIFDRANQIAYAARSIRTDENLFIRYC